MDSEIVIGQIMDALGNKIISASADDYGAELIVKLKHPDGTINNIAKPFHTFKKPSDVDEYINRLNGMLDEAEVEHRKLKS
ncbi:hypothetical protein [Aeromonas allosaccharophila]|uniref:hypothetical protein n=1 Tax=Aeromonas allosaccharophila TaxID=656 RepID=UPI000DCF97A6|nr:hypothetical protein [Aeromonas allosaccharophila]